ncbi:hypothetical protein KSP40_PGU011030 [Platanthera guangdongensis]|uniref:G-patch domain-containing protein n=1 Tax=Platanthera guangdongensis TaxID=2320717 RepID=A0ABR2MVS7_9ASPA
MDEDQEMERFDLDNDYEGGRWIGDEYYYRSKKEKRIQTKEDVIYGSFSVLSSDSDSGGRISRKRSKRDLIRKPDLTKPVQFISTGTVMPGQEIERNAEENNAAENPNPIAGVSFGLGFRVDPQRNGVDDGEDENFLPTAFGRKIKEAAQRREKEREELEREKLRSEKKSTGRRQPGPSKEVGKFENHTRGIGMKLMEKMGYKLGAGLGSLNKASLFLLKLS